ncbi:GH39 family glycosyl hydrolase [Actinoallomurus soli]|uniref:GH39 family glycosyl hydrolase n=1 Tax=Actinoallomurus soli TaxID=2952535 RepID=UPI0020936E24|nr:xylan 1,4-beta-xylosidase [Actinoallomurus soli]MCO5968877.1 xylan 1,4-beta-xylosidase [Actinoallomurus soli]
MAIRKRLPMLIICATLLGALAATLGFAIQRASEGREPVRTVGVVGARGLGDWPVWGFTHTDYSADVGPSGGTAASAIARRPVLQNQHIMGWGAGNPEPAPGTFDFRSLDRRMDYIRRTHGVPVITLCCAPDWMKGGTPGRTDWNTLEVAPTRDHYQDFAALAATVARRYPDVRYFAVWNELKGFFDQKAGRWRYEDFTDFYNTVYDAVKAVNPRIRVGGPYIPMYSYVGGGHRSAVSGPWGSVDQRVIDAIDYWLAHKHGADFIAVDGPTASDDRDVYPDEVTALDKLGAIDAWLRSKTNLPIWWDEYYVEPQSLPWTERKRVAINAAALIELARTGVSTVLYWNNEAQDARCQGCLWISTLVPNGGAPGGMLTLLQDFARWFPAGTPLIGLSSADRRVRVLAQPREAVAVNVSDRRVRTRIGGDEVTLAPYEIRWLDG